MSGFRIPVAVLEKALQIAGFSSLRDGRATALATVLLAFLLLAAPAQAKPRDCAPLWINNGKCRTVQWTCRHHRVPPLICAGATLHARYVSCFIVNEWSGRIRKCRRAWQWQGPGREPIRTGFR